jgi:hypothetical protein
MIIINGTLTTKLSQAVAPLELCAPDGQVLGYFTPAKAGKKHDLDPGISQAEMERRVAAGGGRSLAEILRDLAARR